MAQSDSPDAAAPQLGKDNPLGNLDAEKEVPQSQEIMEAAKAFQNRDFEGSMKFLREAVKKNPDLPPPQIIMVGFFSQIGSMAGVRGALEQAATEDPDDPEAYLIMGDLALYDRRFTEANMLYQKVQDLLGKFVGSPQRKEKMEPRVYKGLAMLSEIRADWPEAQRLYEEWLKLDPNSVEASNRLAFSLFRQAKINETLEALEKAKQLNPENLTPQAILAQFYEKTGDHDNATKAMAEALRLAPDDLQTRIVASQWALETGQIQDAETQAAEALKIDPKSLDALILSGLAAMFKKDYPTAERFFEQAHVQAPRNFAASNNLAIVLAEQKDDAKHRRALEFAEANIQQNPRSAEAASTYGLVLYKLGRTDEAQKAFDVSISGGTAAPDTAYYLACLAYDRGRESQAKEWLDIALKSTGPFAMRQEAEALMEKLKK